MKMWKSAIGVSLVGVLAQGGVEGSVKMRGESFKVRSEVEKLAVIESGIERWRGLKKWWVEYDVVTPGQTNGHVRSIVAVASPDKYYKLKAHGNQFYPWRTDPFAEEVVIRGGVKCLQSSFNRRFREIEISPADALEKSIGVDVLWRVIHRSPMVEYRLPSLEMPKTSPILGRALKAPSCRLLQKTESVKGRECFVFVADGDSAFRTIWVAEGQGFCLMKEEIRASDSGQLIQRITTEETGEVAKGIWLPKKFRIEWFPPGGDSRPTMEGRVRILRFLVNDKVPTSTFEVDHAPGAIRMRGQAGFTQVRAGGKDLLVEMVEFMRKYGGLPSRGSIGNYGYVWVGLSLMCGLGAGVLITAYCYRGVGAYGKER